MVRSRVRNSNINSNAGRKAADFAVSIENLKREVPNVEWVSLVYAWFGTSVDVATCSIRPEAEYSIYPDRLPDTTPYLWSVMGFGRPVVDGGGGWPLVSSYTNPDGSLGLYYGGTINDGSVIRAIQHLRSLGYKVMLYPFLMMDIPPPDPSPFPWRGRIGGTAADVAGFFERSDGYARARDPKVLVAAICDERLAFLQRLRTWPVFGRGWGQRVAEVRSISLAMAGAAQRVTPSPVPAPVKLR